MMKRKNHQNSAREARPEKFPEFLSGRSAQPMGDSFRIFSLRQFRALTDDEQFENVRLSIFSVTRRLAAVTERLGDMDPADLFHAGILPIVSGR